MGQEWACQVDAVTGSETPEFSRTAPTSGFCDTVTADGRAYSTLSCKFKIGRFNKWNILKSPSVAWSYFW